MRRDIGDDIPIRRAGFSIRSPFAVMVLMPFQLPLVLSTLGVSIVFTIWPDALIHSPIGFETKGLMHHSWHYSLLLGSLLLLVGMFWTSTRRLQAELAGLFILMGALVMNLLAQIAVLLNPDLGELPSGLALTLRFGVIVGMAVRAYIIVKQPVITFATTADNGGT